MARETRRLPKNIHTSLYMTKMRKKKKSEPEKEEEKKKRRLETHKEENVGVKVIEKGESGLLI